MKIMVLLMFLASSHAFSRGELVELLESPTPACQLKNLQACILQKKLNNQRPPCKFEIPVILDFLACERLAAKGELQEMREELEELRKKL